MKNLTLFGKVNLGIGIVFFILGIILFVQKFQDAFVLQEQSLSISFICLGMAIFLIGRISHEK